MSKKTTSKSKQPKTTKKPSPRKKSSKKNQRNWLQIVWSVAWKASLAGLVVIVFIGVYLDSVVRQRFEGQLFDLPTVVYARILNLAPGDRISIQEVRNELDVLNYRKVRHPRYPGEYSSSSTKIELFRRPFEFTNGPEPDRHVMLHFDAKANAD